jgi:single-strand DNA-binding protein
MTKILFWSFVIYKILMYYAFERRKIMLNQIVLVGRLVRDPELKESENGSPFTTVTLAVPRSYKNIDGEYDTDFIDCRLWDGIAQNANEFCKKGDLLGVKGRIETRNVEKDEKVTHVTELIAEKITFLSSSKSKKEAE